jgi:hypothetical protein
MQTWMGWISNLSENRGFQWSCLVALGLFFIKLALISINAGEYTDGIIQLTIWNSPVVFFPPGYSVCVWLLDVFLHDLLLSGRVVSILASCLTIPFFYLLAYRVLKSEKEALWAMVILALSPIFSRWSLRVMTDSLFCLLFVICCYQVLLLYQDSKRSAAQLLVWTGMAVLVRYQGLFFLPFVCGFLWIRRSKEQSPAIRVSLSWLLAIVPWAVLGYWIAVRGFGHHEQFIQRASTGVIDTLIGYFMMLETYIVYWPWTITYSVFLVGIIGMAVSWKKYRAYLLFTLFAFCVFLLAQTAFRSFQYRYLLPLLPLWCVWSGRGVGVLGENIACKKLRMILSAVLILNLVAMTSGVLLLQRGAFSDLAQAGTYLQTVWKNARVFSNEQYREGVDAPKMRFWSGRNIEFIGNGDLKAGDIVVLHNGYSADMEADRDRLMQQFDLNVLGKWSSVSVPLLPDIMVTPNQVPLTSNPECMAFRFRLQPYYSVVILLEDKK